MVFSNYRVVFGGRDIDYKNNFSDCLKFLPQIRKIFEILTSFEISEKWYFFEPYVEITWIDNNNKFVDIQSKIIDYLKSQGIDRFQFSTPSDGAICDWYCNSDLEREFGYKSYAKSTELAFLFYNYYGNIKDGKGIENQYVRRCHVLANQLALNYKKEGILLIKRGFLCLLFWFFGHSKAVWIYTKIFRQKY